MIGKDGVYDSTETIDLCCPETLSLMAITIVGHPTQSETLKIDTAYFTDDKKRREIYFEILTMTKNF